jgi:hypothetical protein
MAKKRRHFGRVRQLPSGRWQVRNPARDGLVRPGPHTFPTKTDAEVWLLVAEAEIVQGTWIDPAAGAVSVGEYVQRWINERPGLAPKTAVLYEGLLRLHICRASARFRLRTARLSMCGRGGRLCSALASVQ